MIFSDYLKLYTKQKIITSVKMSLLNNYSSSADGISYSDEYYRLFQGSRVTSSDIENM